MIEIIKCPYCGKKQDYEFDLRDIEDYVLVTCEKCNQILRIEFKVKLITRPEWIQ